MVHPFEALVAPLRFASRRDFAHLSQVKGLRPVLERALLAGREAGIAAPLLRVLAAQLDRVDSPSLEHRRASLLEIGELLRQAGVSSAPELPSAAASNAVPQPVGKRPAASRKPPPVAAPVARRRRPVGQEESRSEARLLSIAPRSGPLATALNAAGFRVSPRLLGALYKREMRRVGDVLFLLPRCYEDRRELLPISKLRPGERGVVVGTVKRAEDVYLRRGRRSFRAVIGDASGSLSVTYFQGGPWLKGRFPLGKRLVVSGEARMTSSGYEMVHPEVEPADDADASPIHFGRIVPIYPGLERQEQRAFRELAFRVSTGFARFLDDPLPEALRLRLGLLPLVEALQQLHFPPDGSDLDALNRHVSGAHQRLAFDELFFLQLGLLLRRVGIQRERGISFSVDPPKLARARQVVPFTLTHAQARVVDEVARDMARSEPMHRLLQGDVGSGKTAVALIAAALALEDGFQVALMAPTEILAEQHQRTFARALAPRGVETALLRGSLGAKERRELRERLVRGELQMVVGTHALFQSEVEFDRLGLVIIDEQHRFGVLQRQALAGKGTRPDVLVMTATPIPRTLAMTLYGDLELSVIDELPPGRTPIRTRVFFTRQRARAFEALGGILSQGQQAFVVYPLVEESEKTDLADATQGATELAAAFPSFRVGLLHGRMNTEEKTTVMEAFRRGETRLLVSTTVIEVGVDVPNASVMVVEAAERFGLSQLHQLRGRVGRGAAESHCFLLPSSGCSKEASERLAILEASSDGFVIAEKDLELRGPGEFLGTRQSGLPELAVANLARDAPLLAQAQAVAEEVVREDPTLSAPEHRSLAQALEERWEGRLALARVG